MTLKVAVLLVIFSGCYFTEMHCASYSNVLVQRGADVVPVEYVNYGVPVYTSPQFAQITSASVDALSNLSPCVSPCVITNGPVSALAPFDSTPNAQIVAYKTPVANVPVVLANKDDPIGYQYAYAVYDKGTGDNKAQSEVSDGNVVQGQYSFIQPDGYRREVVYTADDTKGFNAIVRNVSPVPETSKTEETQDTNKDAEVSSETNVDTSCNDSKNEQLKDGSYLDSTQSSEDNNIETVDNSSSEDTTTTTESPSTTDSDTNSLVSYIDVINCLQSKRLVNKLNAISPITYLIIPTLNGIPKPCQYISQTKN
ncbi:uncharacterized protein LOC126968227 [Leptidea sinapis]|uniref:uncharacterized protein LOC126968227 n=1 Tax=Leptidea sinapis TaxID=189913 RepID=UPI0021C4A4F0|nr:uncharacterized protein LOC126968227 [Leptidea sinapis]